MFRPTLPTLSKASRLPLNSKQGNKNFYKGTRTGNVLRRLRIGTVSRDNRLLFDVNFPNRPRTWNLRQMIIDESRMVSYVVPPGLADTPLKPYVQESFPTTGSTPTPYAERGLRDAPSGYYAPLAKPRLRIKMPEQMDAEQYNWLRENIWNRRAETDRQDVAKTKTKKKK